MEIDVSLENRVRYVIDNSIMILYEANPCRIGIGWENHSSSCSHFKNIKNLPTDKYYFYQCYETELNDVINDLIICADFFPLWIKEFLSLEKTSLQKIIHEYTVENLEKKLDIYEKIINKALKIRENFIQSR